ncbi:MAG: sugar ABC transporter permease [Anaerolineales bacterium]|nr:sugar ABC transporter permease [Anaerolineales bacterium]
MAHQKSRLERKEANLAYLFIAPALALVLLIILFPVIWNVLLSFKSIQLRDLATINLFDFSNLSLDNYTKSMDHRFWSSLRATLIYALTSTILTILMGLWAALVARDKFPGRNLFRAGLLFPYIAPLVSSALIWRLMLDKHIGIVNALIEFFGGEPVGWLTTRSFPVEFIGIEINLPIVLTTIILFEVWRIFPFAFLFILARIQAIPEDMYEAARVDGASPSQSLWYITLPQLKSVFATLFILRFIVHFFKFGDVFLLTGGVAGTDVLSIQIYNWLFARRNVGVASSIGVLSALLLLALAILYQRWQSQQET